MFAYTMLPTPGQLPDKGQTVGGAREVARPRVSRLEFLDQRLQKDNVNSRLLAQTHFLEQPGAVPTLRREIDAFAAAEVRAAPQPLVEGIEQPDRIDAGLVSAAGAHRADQPAELGQHRVELVLEQRARNRCACGAPAITDQPPRLTWAQAIAGIVRTQGPGVGRRRRAGWVRSNARRRPTPGVFVHIAQRGSRRSHCSSRQSNLRAMPLSAGFRHQTTSASPRHGTGGM